MQHLREDGDRDERGPVPGQEPAGVGEDAQAGAQHRVLRGVGLAGGAVTRARLPGGPASLARREAGPDGQAREARRATTRFASLPAKRRARTPTPAATAAKVTA